MAAKITRDVLESYLHCKYKAHLKLAGQQGSKSDYETLLCGLSERLRLSATAKLLDCLKEGDGVRSILLTASALKKGSLLILDGTLEDELVSVHYDGLKKVDGPSALRDFYYVPIMFFQGRQFRKQQKLLLELYALLLSRLQGRVPNIGIIWHGNECKATRVRLSPDLREGERFLAEVNQMQGAAQEPKLILNDHCQICEFRQRCHTEAVQKDNLSLLRGMNEKEIARQNLRGIFTVTQLSNTFRTRRKAKRAKTVSTPHHFPLQALAIRENKVFVYGNPILACGGTRMYLDIEGTPATHSYYLIGLITVDKGIETRQSYWADSDDEQVRIFSKFLDHLNCYPEYSLLHFGSYDVNALRRMRARMPGPYQTQMGEAIRRSINVLSIITPHIYFPTYSNGLKDIARYLGCEWSDWLSSGVQSQVWRERWLEKREDSWKNTLVQYNLEDCTALKRVTEFVEQIIAGRGSTASRSEGTVPFVSTDTLPRDEGRKRLFSKIEFALQNFSAINQCAYFDYQRDKVFARRSNTIRKASRSKESRRNRSCKANKTIELAITKCPTCRSKKVKPLRRLTRQVIDLRFSPRGVKRWVVRYLSWTYRCAKCGNNVMPAEFPDANTKYGRGVVSWCIYHLIACGQNMLRIQKSLGDLFGLHLPQPSLARFKIAAAQHYRARYEEIFQELLRSPVLHIDETEVDLRNRKGYVWVVANLESAYYFYRDSREGSFLKDMLKGYTGILISDFYTAYDSLELPQQRCLIHLMRDLNENLLKEPFNQEFKELSQRFSALPWTIVQTIDRYGLKKRHLHKHRAAARRFLKWIAAKEFGSEVATKYQKRFQKYEGMLSTFLDHDGVPWNNNNAEHAIKPFARYRRFADGRFTEHSIQDYLVVLTIYQTCQYRGINFLKFLLGEKRDVSFGSGVRRLQVECARTNNDHL